MKEGIIKGKEPLDNLQELFYELDTALKYQPKKKTFPVQSMAENSKSDNHQIIQTILDLMYHPNLCISPREQEVLHLISNEHTSAEIASLLYISTHTALSHRMNLMIKMQVRNTAGIVRKAFELGFLSFTSNKI